MEQTEVTENQWMKGQRLTRVDKFVHDVIFFDIPYQNPYKDTTCDIYAKLKYHMWYHIEINGTKLGNQKSEDKDANVDKIVEEMILFDITY
jgi:hypothetical protein